MYTFGWCRGIEEAEILRSAGFDYIECALTALKLEDDLAYRELLPRYLDSPLPASAFNLFFPSDLKVVGPDVDEQRIHRYVAKAAEALHLVGARISVLGSGRSRRVPEEWEKARAEEQFARLLERIADEFTGTGVVLALEPLNRRECNLVNSVEDACRFVQSINRAPIRALADFYHMDEENEPFQTLIDHKAWLAHIHLADTGRLSPGTGRYPYAEFAADLRKTGYDGMISAECTVNEIGEFAPSLAFMKRHFVEKGLA
ncbi:sugar phosphate isomerase/epimerase [Paenibacillus sp. R14(2021)]|uniref:sugar phosphate isomerase/epimerase family protein n=1 Tax=Paenibacillus sp. R14(2021) TaxID=2859228 RepID=UPI0021581D66|nr:sugar phosphate isomerase/epimerase family protein [Paenibacillus sp. R14(2021)]